MPDPFYNRTSPDMIVPAVRMLAITAGGSDLANIPRAVYVDVGGSFTIILNENTDAEAVTLTLDKGVYAWRVRRVTAGTGMYAIY